MRLGASALIAKFIESIARILRRMVSAVNLGENLIPVRLPFVLDQSAAVRPRLCAPQLVGKQRARVSRWAVAAVTQRVTLLSTLNCLAVNELRLSRAHQVRYLGLWQLRTG